MVGGNRIVAFGPGSLETAPDEQSFSVEADEPIASVPLIEEEGTSPAPLPSRGWILPTLGSIAALAWTGGFAWIMRSKFAVASAEEWVALVRDWAVPLLLIAVVSLLALRNSRREALRFGQAARLLADESAQLEHRLATVNRELSLAREFLASQSRDLETLGRLATERLSKEADRLQSLVRDNHDRIEAIGTVSEVALDNMEKLRGQLPVIASSAKDVTNNIGTAGRTAHAQLQDMLNGFQKLNDFGTASERQVHSLRARIDEAVGEFARQAEQLDGIAASRFAALAERGAEFRTQLDRDEVEVLAAIRTRAAALSEELDQTRQQLDGYEAESLTSLRARLTALRDEGASMSRAMRDSESRALESWQEALEAMKTRMNEAIGTIEASEVHTRRSLQDGLAQLAADMAQFDADLVRRSLSFEDLIAERERASQASDVNALASFNGRLGRMDAELAAREERAAQLSEQATDRINQRLAALDTELDERRAQHERRAAEITANGDLILTRLADVEKRMNEIAAHGRDAGLTLDAGLETLTDRLAASRQTLASTGSDVAALTDASVRLLELIQASAQHSREELPRALAAGEHQLVDLEKRIAALGATIETSRLGGETLAGHVASSAERITALLGDIDALQAKLTEGSDKHGESIAELRSSLDAVESQSHALATQARDELSAALAKLTTSAQSAVAEITHSGGAAISGIAERLGDESTAALERAMRNSAAEIAGQLEQAASHAAGVSREAAIQLRDQLAKVDELAGNLERRVAHARQRAEEQIDSDFTRRTALITESLNSNAIDIAKALSSEVGDTAWTAYLKGNRSIFTRRAVSLLENTEARSIAQLYERDRDFHEHVSRYIHDFEAMLRQVLSARDGNALGVTLLSSDMGKLYVALAQAIERLRN